MADKIKYPIGIQTFSEIINEDYLYVDKTEIIYDLVLGAKYVFLSRPRRFGKSLLMSTLEAYFQGRKELFKGLAIEKLESEWVEYPVFRFDLSGQYYNSPERLLERLISCLDDISERYSLESGRNPSEAKGESPAIRFKNLIKEAYRKYGRKVVILIDEYDKPMLDCLDDDDLHEQIKGELRGFYSVMKLSDEYIRFAMLTGVTKFGKVSVFSGLNNLQDISLLPKYNALCGITESEFRTYFQASVRNFAEANDMTEEETWGEFRQEYDGYHFAQTGENVYNPFSVLNAFGSERFSHYWYASGSSSYLVKLVRRHSYMLANLEGARRRENALNDISDITRDFVPLLYQAGYLTIKGYERLTKEYVLGFPNREVYEGFWEALADHMFRSLTGESSFDLLKFVGDVNEGRPKEFMVRLRSLLADTEPGQELNKEIHFQNMMATAFKMMGLLVRTEVHSSLGRCDMQVETPGYVYLFEFKVDGSVEKAMEQIKERDYAGRFGADGRKIYLIAANFSTQTRNFTTPWLIESQS